VAVTSNVAFDQAAFESGIRTAMSLGLPPDPADQAVFVFASTAVNAAPADAEDVPYDPAVAPVVTAGRQVTGLMYALEYYDATGQPVDLGILARTQVVITMLKAEYDQIRGFDYVLLDGDKYLYRREEPVLGLGTSEIHQIHCRAEDDT
jgi:hypothetical protein